MQKLATMALMTSLFLSGCASTDGNFLGDVSTQLFTEAVDKKCHSELNDNKTYQMVALLMSDVQKNKLEDKVCGCVADEAIKSVSMNEIGQAVIDSSARPRIVTKAVTQTLSACVQKLI